MAATADPQTSKAVVANGDGRGPAATPATGASSAAPPAAQPSATSSPPQPPSAPPKVALPLEQSSGVAPGAPLDPDDQRWWPRIKRVLLGRPRNIADRTIFHHMSLVAFLAWVGLGADGLSSAAYGPAEAFLALGEHQYLALVMAIVTPLTVLVIASAYGKIIEAFPQGGGGYVVATKLLGPGPGVLSGCALVVDYVLTITVSITAAGEAIFSMLPAEWVIAKLPVQLFLILLGVTVNIRGVKDAVLPLVPIFMLFIITHALLVLGAIALKVGNAGETATRLADQFQSGWTTLGLAGMFVLFVKAYSIGAGTYTGIEAVSNGLNFMREPRVQTGKRTMLYMSISLASTAAGLLIAFLLTGVIEQHGKTLNAVLIENVANASGIPGAHIFVWATLISEAAILIVAAQTGFIGGPRVLASMALDGWVPRQFAGLSDRLTSQNGIVLLGVAAAAALILVGGNLSTLIVMYTINVFISFTLSMGSMLRYSLTARRRTDGRGQSVWLFSIGLSICLLILIGTVAARFEHGGWQSLAVTGAFVALCFLIRRHYRAVSKRVAQLQRDLRLPDKAHAPTPPAFDPSKPTAAVLVGGYSGLGIHTMLGAMTSFGGYFKNVVFVSVGVIDSGAFKGEEQIEALKAKTEEDLKQYVDLAHRLGIPAKYRCAIGIDLVDELEKICLEVQREIPRASFFAGQLTFKQERWFDRLLHNQTAFQLQRRLHWAGIPMLILPIRVK